MSALHEIQAAFAEAVIRGNAEVLLPQVVNDAPDAAGRVAIYANHYRVTVIEALATTFPVTLQLVGDAFFRAAARRYVRVVPPAGPCLFEYGESFPGFVGDLPEAAGLPYLHDVARLEWTINAARHAPDPQVEDRLGPDRAWLRLHPACRLFAASFNVDEIWQAHQDGSGRLDAVDLNAGPVRLLVGRMADDAVGWIRLPAAEVGFVEALTGSGDIAAALARAQAADPAFDLVPFLAALIENGFALPSHLDREEETDR